MAGIGFELVKLLNRNSYMGVLRAYSLTAFIGSGPGLLIIFSLGILCFFSVFTTPSPRVVQQFLAIIIYLFSGSMLISSFLQYTFFRFIADKIFMQEFNRITPNFNGVLFLQLILSLGVSLPITAYFFHPYGLILQILLVANFVILSMIWIAVVLLTGFKSYRRIIWAFVLGYSAMILLHFAFEQRQNQINFLLLEFLLAQFILFIGLLHAIINFYPTQALIQFDFLKKSNFYSSLVLANFFYTLGFWSDKYLFWFHDNTSEVVFAPLRTSAIYDFPMFIAFLTIIPALGVFMLQMESQFAVIYPKVMTTIFKRKNLAEINAIADQLVQSGRDAIYSLLKTQACVMIMMFLSSAYLFEKYHLLPIYWNLLFVLLIGAGLNALLWALLSLLYYMTQYKQAVWVTAVFAIGNSLFTLITLYAGPWYFGYGYCASLLLSVICALIFLNKDFKDLGYSTFMMTD